jgi:2-polyprenyl-3-methyl-5-hydroxy-6-metoxy-1,4-benzoquinol methylase
MHRSVTFIGFCSCWATSMQKTKMIVARCVEPEWLDELPADAPRAMRSRRDLRWINAFMLQPGIMARHLVKHYAQQAPRTILDVGAGDGTFMRTVARRLASRWRDVTVILLDRQDIVSAETRNEFRAMQWKLETITADVQSVELPRVDIITANLFLHQFRPDPLADLLARAARATGLFVACEPRRATLGLIGSRLCWAIGANDVTRHDAEVSVRAGFRHKELSALWAEHTRWDLHEHAAGLFSHCFAARRMK